MADLSPEEMERIKLEELRKIEEIERDNREKKLRLQAELKKIEEAKKPSEAESVRDDSRVREEIRAREMLSRGYIEVGGQWVLSEEFERNEREREQKVREEEEKKERSKQRKLDREKADYEDYKTSVIIPIKAFAVTIYVSFAMIITGAALAITGLKLRYWMSTLFAPGMGVLIVGLIALLTFLYLLIEAEAKLIERSFIIFENERYGFEDEAEIKNYARILARYLARRINPGLPKPEPPSDEGNEDS
ncbi:MAG TPA: hypothetical protein PKK26_08585 [Candidatus Wallbacteria bacterium]|nr:hypothetical protein [Candidatus Wallbacteria bacterium]